uniref:Uncharacterized protein n=1 Tax=Manihot esculenta TaxID=3983 RepID=A0A2C9UE39_MANES
MLELDSTLRHQSTSTFSVKLGAQLKKKIITKSATQAPPRYFRIKMRFLLLF